MNISKEQWQQVFSIAVSALLAILAVFGWIINPSVSTSQLPKTPEPVVIAPQALSDRTNLDSFGTNQLSNGGNLIFWSGNHTGETARINGSNGAFSHIGFDIDTPSTAISVTNNATIKPTASYQPLTSAGTVTASLSTSGYITGAVLMLVNASNTTIVFTDTGTLKASGNVSLGQYDSANFEFDGTNWIQTGESDN